MSRHTNFFKMNGKRKMSLGTKLVSQTNHLSKSKKIYIFRRNRPVMNDKTNASLKKVIVHKRKEGYFQIENIFNYLGFEYFFTCSLLRPQT